MIDIQQVQLEDHVQAVKDHVENDLGVVLIIGSPNAAFMSRIAKNKIVHSSNSVSGGNTYEAATVGRGTNDNVRSVRRAA